MPFKTKKQKQSAAVKRYTFSGEAISVSYGSEKPSKEDTRGAIHEVSLEQRDKLYLRKDLLKIVILSSIVVGAQIALRLTLS